MRTWKRDRFVIKFLRNSRQDALVAVLKIPAGTSWTRREIKEEWDSITAKYTYHRVPSEHKTKYRAAAAEVIAIFSKGKQVAVGRSDWSPDFKYKIGEMVKPVRKFNSSRTTSCDSGIHFYLPYLDLDSIHYYGSDGVKSIDFKKAINLALELQEKYNKQYNKRKRVK